MAAFRDDMPLVVGINENWDEDTTRAQIVRPDWDFSPIRMKTMHHLPHIFFDTLRPERPDCPVLIPSTFSVARDRLISQDIYSYETMWSPDRGLHATRARADTLDDSQPCHSARMYTCSRSGHA